MIVLDYTDHRPIYEQVIERFKDLILRGVLSEDDALPSVRSLAMELSINPNTIQRAYADLEKTGWIYSVRGKGSFVGKTDRARAQRREQLKKELEQLIVNAALTGVTREEFMKAAEEISWPDARQERAGKAAAPDARQERAGKAAAPDAASQNESRDSGKEGRS